MSVDEHGWARRQYRRTMHAKLAAKRRGHCCELCEVEERVFEYVGADHGGPFPTKITPYKPLSEEQWKNTCQDTILQPKPSRSRIPLLRI
ncbi:uncharacterized protein LACBIDRAFT_299743 [Laccaria bicolor S238N-H82]|uniref:Predicted protein n=1 Tax=Laccaria bicolor (strain S238N-H82 / ATCC MYA-4686) TaxID=486041 RepID=B0DFC2_LACBS|nr:uncharacterized protein LACBIDRAFT_299743 [Laccaria bicolor S238N-H82]EDR06680.1 predicted protein [Laccaria bicolor S238N-H82]|eukprot:XP_001882527.1 predicted protein [Laccaria bicolor S238N-H82]